MTSWGNYKLTQKLGKGSFASVYKAVDERTGETVAIKVISIEKMGNDQRLHQNLLSEIDIMKNYVHPGICQLHENFSSSKHISLVLQYCAGGDLQKFIKKSTRLSEIVTRKFLLQLAAGLEFLHRKNIIHRDIKSQNILLSEASSSAQLKIADFGFAKHLEEAAMAHSVCGTPLYMAPEVFDRHQYDSKVDIWSMGCVLYEMLTGSPPFRGRNPAELFANIRDAKVLNVPEDITVSESMMELLRNTLERDPMKRATLADFVQASNSLGNDPSFVESSKQAPTDDTKSTMDVTANKSSGLYSPAPTTNQSIEPSGRKRIQSADSGAVSATRRHSEGGYGWSHSPPSTAYSAAKSTAASGNTSSALAAAWAAIGLLGGSTNPSSSMKSSPGGTSTPRRRHSVNSPYGISPAKSPVNSTSSVMSRPSTTNYSSEDFVMIDRLPNRPWRAVESESVPSCDNLNRPAAFSPPQNDETYGQRRVNLDQISNDGNCNYVIGKNEDCRNELHYAQFVSSLREYSEYVCSIVCALTQVADNLVSQIFNGVQSQVQTLDSLFLSTPRSSPSSPPLSNIVTDDKRTKYTSSSPEILKNAMSLYLHALGIMQDTMTRIVASKKQIISGADNTCVEILGKLSEGLSCRFKILVHRAESCSNLMSNQFNIEEKDKAVNSPGPIIYYTAIELAKEASISAMLGNLEQACAQYEIARLLLECLLMTAISPADRKVLQSFVDMFVQSLEELKKTKDQFTLSDTGKKLFAGDAACNEYTTMNLRGSSKIHLTVTEQS